MTKCFFNFRNCSFITNKTIQETCCTIIPDEIKTQEQYNLWYNKTQKEFLNKIQLKYPNEDIYCCDKLNNNGENNHMKNQNIPFKEIICLTCIFCFVILLMAFVDMENRKTQVLKDQVERTDLTNRMAVERLDNTLRYFIENFKR